MRNIVEGSFAEELTVAGKYIFEGELKFAASEESKKFDSTASADWGAIGEQSRKFLSDRVASDRSIPGKK